MKTINVSFEDSEMEEIEKAKNGQSWRKFILERAAIDSSNELHTKGINADALRGLCLEYDLKYGTYPEKYYEGLSLLVFFLQTVTKTDILVDKNETDTWKKQIAGMKKTKTLKIEPIEGIEGAIKPFENEKKNDRNRNRNIS